MSIAAQTLAKAFERQAMRFEKRSFLTRKEDKQWRDYTWSDIYERARRLRTGLIHLGITSGDRIAILAENSPEWVIVDQAVLGMGGVVVPLYTTSGPEEMHHVLMDSGARLVAVYGERLIEKVQGLGDLPELEGILAMHQRAVASDEGHHEVITIEQLSGFEPTRAIEGNKDDLATLIYTSGTTGQSKGVMLTHGNLLANCESNFTALNITENDLLLSFLPIAHSFERTAGYYTMMLSGGTIAYAEGLGQIAQNLLEIEPTLVLAVPRLLEMIYDKVNRTVEEASRTKKFLFQSAIKTGMQAAEYRLSGRRVPAALELKMALYRRQVFAKIKGIFGSRMRYLISGGAPLPQYINEFFTAAEVPLVEGYGLTEAAPVVACNLHGHTRIGTVGRALSGVKVKTAPDGELLVHGDNVMKGYYNQPEDTAEVLDSEGWLHTGDIGEIDSDGFIKITDRKKEIIVLSGGKNISPAKIEAKLVADPFIAQACVIGDRRKHLAALIVPNFGHLKEQHQLNPLGLEGLEHDEMVREPALQSFFLERIKPINKTLSDVEAVTDLILLETPFSQDNGEMTPTLKIRRKAIQEHYREEIESLYNGTRRAIPMPPPPSVDPAPVAESQAVETTAEQQAATPMPGSEFVIDRGDPETPEHVEVVAEPIATADSQGRAPVEAMAHQADEPVVVETTAEEIKAAPEEPAPEAEVVRQHARNAEVSHEAVSDAIDESLHHNGTNGTNGANGVNGTNGHGSYGHAAYEEVVLPPHPASFGASHEVVLEAGQVVTSAGMDTQAYAEPTLSASEVETEAFAAEPQVSYVDSVIEAPAAEIAEPVEAATPVEVEIPAADEVPVEATASAEMPVATVETTSPEAPAPAEAVEAEEEESDAPDIAAAPLPLGILANGLQQIAFVVKNLNSAQSFFCERMGVPRFFVMENFGDMATEKTFRGRPTKHKFKAAIGYSGNTQIELIEHVSGNTTYKEFLDRRGEGMHHLGYFIEDRAQHDQLYKDFASRHTIVQSGRFGETIYTYFDTEAAIGAIIELVYLDPEAKAMLDRVKRGEF